MIAATRPASPSTPTEMPAFCAAVRDPSAPSAGLPAPAPEPRGTPVGVGVLVPAARVRVLSTNGVGVELLAVEELLAVDDIRADGAGEELPTVDDVRSDGADEELLPAVDRVRTDGADIDLLVVHVRTDGVDEEPLAVDDAPEVVSSVGAAGVEAGGRVASAAPVLELGGKETWPRPAEGMMSVAVTTWCEGRIACGSPWHMRWALYMARAARPAASSVDGSALGGRADARLASSWEQEPSDLSAARHCTAPSPTVYSDWPRVEHSQPSDGAAPGPPP